MPEVADTADKLMDLRFLKNRNHDKKKQNTIGIAVMLPGIDDGSNSI